MYSYNFVDPCYPENDNKNYIIMPSLLSGIHYINTVLLGVKPLHVSRPLNSASAACNKCLVAPWNSAVACRVVCFCLIVQSGASSVHIAFIYCVTFVVIITLLRNTKYINVQFLYFYITIFESDWCVGRTTL